MALLLTIFLILHFGIGLVLPYKHGFKPYFYKMAEEAGIDLERRLNRENRPQSVRIVRGAAIGLMMGILGCLIGVIVRYAGQIPFGFVIELAFLSCCISFMTPMKIVREISNRIDKNELPQAIAALQPYLQESLENADVHTVIRKTAEFIAISLNQFFLAPVFWFLVAGPVGMSVYVIFSALQQAFGLPDQRHLYFGQFVRLIDTLMNLVPAVLSIFFLMASALFVSRSSPFRAATTIFQQGRASNYRYQSLLIIALAGGLGVTLGGPVRYSADYAEDRPWLGSPGATARLIPEDLARAALLQYVFFICVIGMISVLMVFSI